MKRIIAHWAVSKYKANHISLKHYHEVVQGDGTIVKGDRNISDNAYPIKGPYAAHTRHSNTDAIGISCAAMYGAKSVTHYGDYPITDVQFEAMCKRMAKRCMQYEILVTDKTVLTHAEVEKNLGIKQRGKWDISVLPFKKLTGAKRCGDYMRKRVQAYIDGAGDLPTKTVKKPLVPNGRIQWLQRLLMEEGYDLEPDGVYGRITAKAIGTFQAANAIPITETFDAATVVLLRANADARRKPKPSTKAKKTLEKVAIKNGFSTTKLTAGIGVAGGGVVVVEKAIEVSEKANGLIERVSGMGWTGAIAVGLIGAFVYIWLRRGSDASNAAEALSEIDTDSAQGAR